MNSDRWIEITARINANDSDVDRCGRICQVAIELLGVDHTSLSMVITNNYQSMGSSSPLAMLLEEQQFALGDGPSFDATIHPEPILVGDITKHTKANRWPIFSDFAAKHGIRAVHAFPLRIGGAHIGVLTLFHSHAKLLTASEYSDGLALASLSAAELVRIQATKLAQTNGVGEITEIYEQSSLQLAAGMVAEALNCSVLDGLVRIRARAFADDVPVTQIAKGVLARTIEIEK